MAPPTYKSMSTASGDALAGGQINVDKPAGTAENDLLVALVNRNGAAANIDVHSGWTKIDELNTSTNLQYPALFYKEAGASEPAQYTFGQSSGGTLSMQVGVVCYEGNEATPLDAHAVDNDNNASDTAWLAPSVNQTVADCLVVRGYTDVGQTITATTPGLEARKRFQVQASGTPRAVALFDEEQASIGATGTEEATTASASGHVAFTACFEGAEGAPPTPGDPDALSVVAARW